MGNEQGIYKAIQDGKSYLEKNDLNGFYKFLEDKCYCVAPYILREEDITQITMLLEEWEVPTLHYLTEIPFCWCYNNSVPQRYITGDSTFVIPPNIKTLKFHCLSDIDNVTCLNMSNIKFVDDFPINGGSIEFITLGPNPPKHIGISTKKWDNFFYSLHNLQYIEVPADSRTFDYLFDQVVDVDPETGEHYLSKDFNEARLEIF